MSLDVDRSEITGNRGSNVFAGTFNALDSLAVKIQRSDLSDAEGGLGLSLADVAFEDLGGTGRAVIDLGGGELRSRGGNCITGGPLAANVVAYDVSAEGNWWGSPGGPGPAGRWWSAARSTPIRP